MERRCLGTGFWTSEVAAISLVVHWAYFLVMTSLLGSLPGDFCCRRGGCLNEWFTAVWQAFLEECVAQETSQKAFQIGCRDWREVKMARVSERRVSSRHLLDKCLEAHGGGACLGGIWEKGLEGQVGGALLGMWDQL